MPPLPLIIQLTFPYTSQGAFCGVCSADSNGTSYHRSVGRCEPCEGSILPAIVSAVVALAVLLALLAVLRTSRGHKLLIKLHVSKRVNKYMDDQYEKGKAEVRENTSEMQFGLPDISLPSIFLTLTLKFPKVKWPELPAGQLYSLQLPQYDLPEFRLRYPGLQWPLVPNLAYVCNLVRIAFPDLQWPLLPDLEHLEWAWADWELPNVDVTLPLATLRSPFPQLAWDPSTVHHGDINLASAEPSTSEDPSQVDDTQRRWF